MRPHIELYTKDNHKWEMLLFNTSEEAMNFLQGGMFWSASSYLEVEFETDDLGWYTINNQKIAVVKVKNKNYYLLNWDY